MKNRRRRHRRWPRRIGRGLLAGLALALLLFGALQVVLSTPWAARKAGERLSARVGWPVELARVGWTPWGGIRLEGMRIPQPEPLAASLDEPLLEVGSVRVWPDYRALIRGDSWLRAIEIEDPRVSVAVEMLAVIAGSDQTPPAEPGPLAQRDGPTGPQVGKGRPGPSTPRESPAARSTPPLRPTVPSRVQRAPVRTVLKGGGLRILRANGTELMALRGMVGEMPLFGAEETAELTIEEWALGEHAIKTNIRIPLTGTPVGLKATFPGTPEEPVQVTGHLRVGYQRRVPFQALVGIKCEDADLGWGEAGSVRRAEGLIQGVGWLGAPSSWQGQARVELSGVTWSAGSRRLEFDRGAAVAELRNGVLRIPDARLVGDEAALLGNGWLNRSGGLGVVRVVVPAAGVGALQQELARRGVEAPWRFGRLEPGDRRFADVTVWREPSGWRLGLGTDGPVVRLEELMK